MGYLQVNVSKKMEILRRFGTLKVYEGSDKYKYEFSLISPLGRQSDDLYVHGSDFTKCVDCIYRRLREKVWDECLM